MLRRIPACLLLLALGFASPSQAARGDVAATIAKAEAALRDEQPRTARIELMNAIKADPGNRTAHLLQAETYLRLGNGVAAEAELLRARDAGADVDGTRHLMGLALAMQWQSERALVELDPARVPPRFAAAAARARGRALAILNDAAGAEKAFAEAVRRGPRDPRIWTDLGRFRMGIGDTGGAIVAVDNALTLDRRIVDALVLKGQLTREQSGLVSAMPWFDRALARDDAHVPALLERAATLGELGQARAMLAATRLALAREPGNAQAFYLQAVLAARARNYRLARQMMLRTGGALDGLPGVMLLYAAIEYQDGNFEQSVDQLQRLLSVQPDNAKARRLLGASQYRAGDVRGAIDTLRPIADMPQADSYTLTIVGRGYERLGDRARAAPYLDRAMMPTRILSVTADAISGEQLDILWRTSRPGDARTNVPLIRALLHNGRNEDALQVALTLQRANAGAAQAHLIVGDVLDQMGRAQEALGAYRRAATISFTEPVALRLIQSQRRLGDARGAYLTLDGFLRQNPQSVSAQLLAADFLLNMGAFSRALPVYERLRARLGDRDAMMLNNLAWSYAQTGRPRRALVHARRAYALTPANPAIADTYGWLLVRTRRDVPRGISLLEQAVARAPAAANARWHLAQAYALNRQPAEARVAALAALKLPGFGDHAAARSLLARL